MQTSHTHAHQHRHLTRWDLSVQRKQQQQLQQKQQPHCVQQCEWVGFCICAPSCILDDDNNNSAEKRRVEMKKMLLLNEDRTNRAVRCVCERARTHATANENLIIFVGHVMLLVHFFLLLLLILSLLLCIHCRVSVLEVARQRSRTRFSCFLIYALCIVIFFFALSYVCVFVYLPFSSLFSVFSLSLSASFGCVYVWIYVYAFFFTLYYYISCVKLLISSLVRTTSRNGAVCLDFLVFEFECWRCRHRHYHQRYRHLKTEHIEIKIHFLANKIY